MKNILLIILFTLPFSDISGQEREQGALVDSELIESMTVTQMLLELLPIFPIPPTIDYDGEIYKIEYETLDHLGNATIASGALSIPLNSSFAFPMISFQHGTVIERTAVASEYGFDIISMMLTGSGYIGLQPDYLGLGVSEIFHPYHVAEPYANSIMDMIRASRQFLEENGIPFNDQLFITGYSEGGYATLAVQKWMELYHMEEFPIVASAPCAGAYDLSGVMADLFMAETPYDQPFYLPYSVFAYNESYQIYEDINVVLVPEYQDTLFNMFDGNHNAGQINSFMPSVPLNIFQDEFVNDFSDDPDHPLRIKLAENDLYDWVPQTDTRLYHSLEDELVPYENSEVAYNAFIEGGAENVELITVDTGSHAGAAPFIILAVFEWFESMKSIDYVYPQGDVNGNDLVNVTDIIIMIDFILEYLVPTDDEFDRSDLNGDGQIDVSDILLLVEIILES